MKIENAIAQMKKGVLDLCILSIINEEEAYPSDMINRLKSADLIVVEGTLYPILSRLKNSGLLEYHWKESNAGPPRKYFTITEEGKQALNVLLQSWHQFVQSVNQSIKIIKTENEQNT
ncbi:MAG: PadR family transcriptional regulator [Saprospiraceae bacterium]|jgi:PadR family transcriptional regulator PadR|nr:PadR family transcriptional regulator [Saprospiraceae bacterium]MBK7737955.1 PadR family transcriptional regulator [Saprospiraceae bacterium]MBK7913466.1 PadR family transcriptional regulator [Saprospiraceae bacterium]